MRTKGSSSIIQGQQILARFYPDSRPILERIMGNSLEIVWSFLRTSAQTLRSKISSILWFSNLMVLLSLMKYLRSCFIDEPTWSYFSENQIIDTTALTVVLYASDGSQDCAIMRDTPHEHNLACRHVVCDSGRDFFRAGFRTQNPWNRNSWSHLLYYLRYHIIKKITSGGHRDLNNAIFSHF